MTLLEFFENRTDNELRKDIFNQNKIDNVMISFNCDNKNTNYFNKIVPEFDVLPLLKNVGIKYESDKLYYFKTTNNIKSKTIVLENIYIPKNYLTKNKLLEVPNNIKNIFLKANETFEFKHSKEDTTLENFENQKFGNALDFVKYMHNKYKDIKHNCYWVQLLFNVKSVESHPFIIFEDKYLVEFAIPELRGVNNYSDFISIVKAVTDRLTANSKFRKTGVQHINLVEFLPTENQDHGFESFYFTEHENLYEKHIETKH